MSAIETNDIQLGYKRWDKEWNEFLGRFEKVWEWELGASPDGEVGFIHSIYNLSEKMVKYVYFDYVAYNRLGESVGEVKKLRYTGPLKPNENAEILADRCWMHLPIKSVGIQEMKVEYMDGSEEVISGKDIKCIDDEDSTYQFRIREAEAKVLNEKKAKGVTVWAGNTDEKECKKEKIGDITFYIRNDTLVGLESSKNIKHLEIPSRGIKQMRIEDFGKLQVESVILPRDLKNLMLRGSCWASEDFFLFSYDDEVSIKVVVPKETEHVCITKQGLRCIDKILFESPKGWTVSSKILGDYSRFIKHLDSGKLLEANKTWLGKLFSKK